jgi:hypothetical protein
MSAEYQKWSLSRLEAFKDILKDIETLSHLNFSLDDYKTVLDGRVQELVSQIESDASEEK